MQPSDSSFRHNQLCSLIQVNLLTWYHRRLMSTNDTFASLSNEIIVFTLFSRSPGAHMKLERPAAEEERRREREQVSLIGS